MDRHRERLEQNHRIGRIYATWDRMGEAKQRDYLDSAEAFLGTLEPARAGWARTP
jgi:deoxyribodipyrimidine photolyase-related protein